MNAIDNKTESNLLPQWYLVVISIFGCGFNAVWSALLTVGFATHAQVISLATKIDTAKLIGLTMAAGAICATVVPLYVGGLSDRCKNTWGKRKPYIFYGTCISIVSLGIMAFSAYYQELYSFVAGFVLLQLGMNTASGAYLGIIPDQVPDHQKGTASGYMNMMNLIGVVIGVAVSGLLLRGIDNADPLLRARLAMMYGAIAGVLFLMMSITLGKMKDTPSTLNDKFEIVEYTKSLWISPKKYPNFAWVWITRFMVMLGFYSLSPYLKLYLGDVIGLKDTVGPLQSLLILIVIGQTISSVTSGFLADKFGRIRMIYVSNTLISIITLAFVWCTTLTHALIVGLLFGICYGVYTTVDWALGTSVLPTKTNSGKEMAVWHIAITLPQSFGPPIGAFLLGLYGSENIGGVDHYTHMGYATLMTLSAIYFALGAFGLRFLKGVK